MSLLQFFTHLNGVAQLWAADGQFLGLLSSNQHDPNSISNLNGIYGNPHGLFSIRNSYGMYGGQDGLYSPYNSYCLNPPIVFYQDQAVLMVTKNIYVLNNGLTVIDPDILLTIYASLSNSTTISCATSMDLINQSTQNIQYFLNQSADIINSMFR